MVSAKNRLVHVPVKKLINHSEATLRSAASHMLSKIKQQLFANVTKGAPQQLFQGNFLRVCLGPLNSNISPVCEAGFLTPVHITVKQKSQNRPDI